MGWSHRHSDLKQDLKLLYFFFPLSKVNVSISEHLWLLSKITQWSGHSLLPKAFSNSWESEQQPLFSLEEPELVPWVPVADWMCPPQKYIQGKPTHSVMVLGGGTLGYCFHKRPEGSLTLSFLRVRTQLKWTVSSPGEGSSVLAFWSRTSSSLNCGEQMSEHPVYDTLL